MALLFIIVMAILIACAIKGAAKLAFKVIPIVFIAGVIFIGMSHQSATPPAAPVVQPVAAAAPAPPPQQSEPVQQAAASSSGSPSRGAPISGAESASTPKVELAATDWNDKAEPISHAEPGSATEWNEEDTKPSKKHGKTTRRAKTEAEPDATPTIREHVDEILDAPDPKAAVRAYADWMDELNEQMDKAAAEMDDQDQD
jgi:hypothetical protein